MAVNVSDLNFDERRIVVLVHSAIAGASIAAVVELASRATLDQMHLASLGAFAIAIPAAIAMVVLASFMFGGNQTTQAALVDAWPRSSYLLAVLDQIACYAGFAILFFSFHFIVGAAFVAVTLMAYGTLWSANRHMKSTDTAPATTVKA